MNLSLLSERAEDFLKDRGFLTEKDESAEEYKILWASPDARNMRNAMTVRIFGNPNDFGVEIIASERTRRFIKLGLLTQMFGGGYLVVRGLKAKEALEKLEKEFWIYMEEKVAELAGSYSRDSPSDDTLSEKPS
jgi:hypothetical protein